MPTASSASSRTPCRLTSLASGYDIHGVNRDWVARERMRLHCSMMFEEIPAHEAINDEIEAIRAVTFGIKPEYRVYASRQFGRRWWRRLWTLMGLQIKRSYIEYAYPERTVTRMTDYGRKHNRPVITGLTA